MKKDFDSSVPVHEQLLQASARKKVGRKHEHKTNFTRTSARAINAARHNEAMKSAKVKRHRALVKKYWSGEIDTYPL